MTPQPHVTSVKLDPDVYLILQTLQAQRRDITQTELINIAVRFYHKYVDNQELDAMTANLAAIRKQLDDLLLRSAPTLDAHLLAQAIVAQLDARMPVETTPAPVIPEPPTPTPATQKPRWAERFGKRFGKPPVEHW